MIRPCYRRAIPTILLHALLSSAVLPCSLYQTRVSLQALISVCRPDCGLHYSYTPRGGLLMSPEQGPYLDTKVSLLVSLYP